MAVPDTINLNANLVLSLYLQTTRSVVEAGEDSLMESTAHYNTEGTSKYSYVHYDMNIVHMYNSYVELFILNAHNLIN